jgi:hypothetical protein
MYSSRGQCESGSPKSDLFIHDVKIPVADYEMSPQCLALCSHKRATVYYSIRTLTVSFHCL